MTEITSENVATLRWTLGMERILQEVSIYPPAGVVVGSSMAYESAQRVTATQVGL